MTIGKIRCWPAILWSRSLLSPGGEMGNGKRRMAHNVLTIGSTISASCRKPCMRMRSDRWVCCVLAISSWHARYARNHRDLLHRGKASESGVLVVLPCALNENYRAYDYRRALPSPGATARRRRSESSSAPTPIIGKWAMPPIEYSIA